ncbi:ARP2/3 actin-organizing complex subunit Sop2 [Sorochytrium milnesiophthora]
MATHEAFQLVNGPITAHAFNADRSVVAISPNSPQVHLYAKGADGSWALTHVLDEHDKLVTSIDWAPKSNRIVTCSQDRNAYVWQLDSTGAVWKPTLVLLRIDRAATFVRWSPNEDKFAVASGSKCVSVCYFDQEMDWWASKHLKKPIRSTILSLDWHPNNVLLACGSADNKFCKAFVLSAYIKGIDSKPPANPWGEKLPFNTVCADLPSVGWVHAIAFSPSGAAIAWASHDSSLTIHNAAQGTTAVVRTSLLPFVSLIWLDESNIVAAGHDCTPVLFTDTNGQWHRRASAAAGNSALNMFRAMDSRGTAAPSASDAGLSTVHQNTISCVRAYNQAAASFSTTAGDGKLVLWSSMADAMARLRVH